MKIKKQIIKIGVLSIVLMFLVANMNTSYGILGLIPAAVGTGAIVALLSTAIQVGALAIASGLNVIIAGITGISGDGMIQGVKDIIFNQSGITTASFFKGLGNGNGINDFAQKIGEYYIIVRNLSVAILLFILLYIGIRMAISTVAEQEAKYKKMLQNWAVSIALVFLLHFIIIITFVVNDILVNTLYTVVETHDANVPPFLTTVALLGGGVVPIAGWPEVIVYVTLTVITVAFLVTYIKRVVTLGFLIVISPLITITYSIDKIGDGKSQALNTWLKEFIYSVLIQPFHCVIYIVFVQTSLDMFSGVGEGMTESILAMSAMLFMLKAENVVKKIFGLRADSMGDTMKTGAMAISLATGLASKIGGDAKGNVPEMKRNKKGEKSSGGAKDASGGSNAGNGNENKDGNEGTRVDTEAGNAEGGNAEGGNSSDGAPTGGTGTQDGNADDKHSAIHNALAWAKATEIGKSLGRDKERIGKAIGKAKEGFGNLKENPRDAIISGLRKAPGAALGAGYKTLLKPTGDFFKRYSGGKGVLRGAAKFAAKGGLAAVGGIAGAATSDGSGIISGATAAMAAGDAIERKVQSNQNQKQAKQNQIIFAEAYKEYAEEYRRRYGEDASDEKIASSIEDLVKKDGTEIQEDWQRNIYRPAKDIQRTGVGIGYKDGDGIDFLLDTLREAQNQDR